MTVASRERSPAPDHPVPVPGDVEEALVRAEGRLGPMAHHVVWFWDVSSTNDVAARLADAGCAEGAVVVADAQSRGRGRHGRSWASPAGAGLYASIVLRPPARAVPLLTLAAGLAVSDGIRAASGLETCVKWPNDVHAVRRDTLRTDTLRTGTPADCGPGRKIAGLLAEAGSIAAGVQHVVLGVGINIATASYPPELAERATSLELELGRRIDRGLLLAECLAAIWARYAALRDGDGRAMLDAWRDRARPTWGRAVEWNAGAAIRRGRARDVDEGGALLVETVAGLETVLAGPVRWVS